MVRKIATMAINFTGTGDVSASLLLAWTHLLGFGSSIGVGSADNAGNGSKLGQALLNTVESVQV